MSSKKQLADLEQGVNHWNAWRIRHPRVEIDLTSADLRNRDLSGINLSHSNLRGANLQGAVIVASKLQYACLDRAQLQGTNLERGELQGCSFVEADLQWANLSQCNLHWANFHRSNLRLANLQSANLQEADLRMANCLGTNLKYAILVNANIDGAIALNATQAKHGIDPELPSAKAHPENTDPVHLDSWLRGLLAAVCALQSFKDVDEEVIEALKAIYQREGKNLDYLTRVVIRACPSSRGEGRIRLSTSDLDQAIANITVAKAG